MREETNLVGLSITHYFKLDGFGSSLEGVVSIFLDQNFFSEELSAFAMDFDKFYFASGKGQNLILSVTED